MEELVAKKDCRGIDFREIFTEIKLAGPDQVVPCITYGGLAVHAPFLYGAARYVEPKLPQFTITHVGTGTALGYVGSGIDTAVSIAKSLVDKFTITGLESTTELRRVISFKHEIKRMRTFGSLSLYPVACEEVDAHLQSGYVAPDTRSLVLQTNLFTQ